jgi:1,4-alpha-glucan branching enzyme
MLASTAGVILNLALMHFARSRLKRNATASASTVQQDKTMANAKGDIDHLPIYDLEDKFKDNFSYQIKRFVD